MSIQTSITGTYAGPIERAFNGFTDEKTGRVVEPGVTRRAYVHTPQEMVEIRIPDDLFAEFANFKVGVAVAVPVTIYARNSRVSYTAAAAPQAVVGK